MDISRRKIEFIKDFLQLQNEALITRLENIIKKEKAKDDKLFSPMSIEDFNQRIEQSIKDAEEGRIISAEDLLKEIDGWS